jgi:hypothetical protein
LDIIGEANRGSHLGFGVHIDALEPSMLREVLSGATMDAHTAELRAGALTSLGIDGVFGTGWVLGKRRDDLDGHGHVHCSVVVSGLAKNSGTPTEVPPDDVLDAWNGWQPIPVGSPWAPRHLFISDKGNHQYLVRRLLEPWQPVPPTTGGPWITRDETINMISCMMEDSMPQTRMVASRLLYRFECTTYPWSAIRRREFTAAMDMLVSGGLLVSNRPGAWTFEPMGPRAHPGIGNVHVTMRRPPPASPQEISWASSAGCSMRINAPPDQEFAPVFISVIMAC